MELESGSSSVDRVGSSGRRRASDGGACSTAARASFERGAAGAIEVEAHGSRHVGDHVAEDAGCDRAVPRS